MILRILIFLGIIYCIYLLILYFLQRNILFPGQYIKESSIVTKNNPDYEIIWIKTSFGKSETWFIRSEITNNTKAQPAVIFAHGNGELIDDWPFLLSPYNKFGIHILLVEFPGYGRSQGSPSQKSINEVFLRAYDSITSRKDVDPEKIIVHGRSVGGGAACLLAKQRAINALILQSTFTSLKQFAIQFLAPSFLIKDPFDNLSIVKKFNGPILLIHGIHDKVIPYKNSLELSKYSKNAQLINYECRHNDCPPEWDVYWKDIKLFLENNSII